MYALLVLKTSLFAILYAVSFYVKSIFCLNLCFFCVSLNLLIIMIFRKMIILSIKNFICHVPQFDATVWSCHRIQIMSFLSIWNIISMHLSRVCVSVCRFFSSSNGSSVWSCYWFTLLSSVYTYTIIGYVCY